MMTFVRWTAIIFLTFATVLGLGYLWLLAWDRTHQPKLPPELRQVVPKGPAVGGGESERRPKLSRSI